MPYDNFGFGALSGLVNPLSGQTDGYNMFDNLQMPQMPDLNGMAQQQTAQLIADPNAGQSWWQKLISGAVIGLAGGAGAPDAATAIAQGFQATMQKREADRQAILQAKQYEMQQKMYESKLMSDYIDQLGKYQQIKTYPIEMKAKLDESLSQVMANMHQAGLEPTAQFNNEQEYQDAVNANKKPDIGNFHIPIGGKIFAYSKDTGDMVPDNYSVPFKNADGSVAEIPIPKGTKWSAVPTIVSNFADIQVKRMQEEGANWRAKYTADMGYKSYAEGYRGATGYGAPQQLGQLTDQQRAMNSLTLARINDYDMKINKLQTDLDNAMPEDKPAIQKQIETYTNQIQTLESQYKQTATPAIPPPGTRTKSGIVEGSTPDGMMLLRTYSGQLYVVDPATGQGHPYTPQMAPIASH